MSVYDDTPRCIVCGAAGGTCTTVPEEPAEEPVEDEESE